MNTICRYKFALLFLICLLSVTLCGDGQWPSLRGPSYDGHSSWSSFYLPWDVKGPPVLWKKQIGQGYSGAIIVDGKIYTQFQKSSGQYLICLDLLTSEKIWSYRYEWAWEKDGEYPGPYATPSFYKDKIYFAGCFGTIGCLDAKNGKLIWKVKLDELLGTGIAGFGYASSPLLFEGKLFLPGGQDASLIALNSEDGKLVWKSGKFIPTYSSCVPAEFKGRKQIISVFEDAIASFAPETGKVLWADTWKYTYNPVPAWPVYSEPFIFQGFPFLEGYKLIELKELDCSMKADLLRADKQMSNDICSPVVKGGYVYGFDIRDFQTDNRGKSKGTFKCIELKTGEQAWETDLGGAVSVLASGEKLILFTERGTLIVAEASEKKYSELARFAIYENERCWTSPSLSDGYLLLKGGNTLTCVYLGDPLLMKRKAHSD